MPSSDISLLGHIVTTLSFFGIVIYTFLRQKTLQRTTQYSAVLFYVIIGLSLIFAVVNLIHIAHEIFSEHESQLTADLDWITQYFGIFVLSALILVLSASKIIIRPKFLAGRVLAIGAHPDDIEVAIGGSLAKMRDVGYTIHEIVMTRGGKGGNVDTRPGEARNGAEFLGLEGLQVLDFADTCLSAEVINIANVLEETIAKTRPDIIFTHSKNDLHQDHRAVYEATMQATRDTRTTILCYESPSATQDFYPTYFIDVGKYVDVKLRAIREHWGQRKKPYMKPDVIRGKLAFRGSQAKVNYAEGFEVARMVSAI
jgi:LmbE family N-acetylglucosaminyl deacetylase